VIRFCLVLLAVASAQAAEIRLIYPRLAMGQDTFRYNSSLDSTFVLGQVVGFEPGIALSCAGQAVTLGEDGAFLSFLKLPWSAATSGWNFTLTKGRDEISELFFPFAVAAPEPEIIWAPVAASTRFVVNQRSAHTRTVVGGSYQLFPDAGTVLRADAVSEKWIRFELGGGRSGIIERRFVDSVGVVESGPARLLNGRVTADDGTTLVEFVATERLLSEVMIDPHGKEMQVRLYATEAATDRIRYKGSSHEFVRDISWRQEAGALDLFVTLAPEDVSGYRVVASDSTWGIEIYCADWRESGLRGKRIVLDPGHGGDSDGAVGPRGTREKDVMLRWAKLLGEALRSTGAEVLLTRTEDTAIGLPERVERAREFDADVFLSLHANALPDGENPFLRMGCGTYYFQPLSRKLAETLQECILERTGLGNDGVFDANFAVVRPTDFPAVLIEAAYMMHPKEELLLGDDEFLRKLSRGVTEGLAKYFSKVPAR